MKFLCGCDVESKQKLYGAERFEAGLRACPEHGRPLENYLSPQVQGPAGNRVHDWKAFSPPGKFTPALTPETVARQQQLRDLDRQAAEILEKLRLTGNGDAGKLSTDNTPTEGK